MVYIKGPGGGGCKRQRHGRSVREDLTRKSEGFPVTAEKSCREYGRGVDFFGGLDDPMFGGWWVLCCHKKTASQGYTLFQLGIRHLATASSPLDGGSSLEKKDIGRGEKYILAVNCEKKFLSFRDVLGTGDRQKMKVYRRNQLERPGQKPFFTQRS